MTRSLLLALAIGLLAAAPASASIEVKNVTAAPADKQAGAHSNFTLAFDIGGDSGVKDLEIDLPPGLIGNPNVPAKCTKEQFQSDSCPPESKVGTQTVNATVLILPVDVSGEVFNLVPNPGEPARLGIKLDAPTGTIRLESSVRVRTESDNGLTSRIENIPNDFKINKISLTLNADANKGKFETNPTSCKPAPTKLRATAYDGTTAAGEGGFTPTGCEKLAYNPKLTAKVGAEGSTAAGSIPPLSTVIEQGPDESASRSASVTLLKPLGPNAASLNNVCKVADYNADKCGETSIVGQATAVTPLLPSPLSGPVRLVENPGNLPKVVVYLNGLINIRLAADIALQPDGTTTTFPTLPDVPLSRFQLDFKGGPTGLVGTTADLCSNDALINGKLSSQSGKDLTVSTKAVVTGCKGGGGNVNPPGAGAKKPLASVSLRRLAGRRPLFVAHVKRRSGGKKLRQVRITLPKGLSLKKGRRTLVVRSRSKSGAARLDRTVTNGKLRVSRALKRRVKRHPRLIVKLVVTDLSGSKTTLKKRVRAR